MRPYLSFLAAAIFGAILHAGGEARAQDRLNLYDGPAPHSLGSHPDIDNPFLLVFLPPAQEAPSAAIVICPGGGYAGLSMESEGTNVARWWQDHGVAAMVLRYRLPGQDYRHPIPLQDAQRALRLVRSRAAAWHVDPRRVGIMGFSAGGHLASTAETHYDAGDPNAPDPTDRPGCRPDFAVLVYPVITMKDGTTHAGSKSNLLGPNPDPALVESLSNETQVTAQTPPTLLVLAADDKLVPPANSDLMLAALRRAGVPSAMQEYPAGGHGFGFKRREAVPVGWLDAAAQWLSDQKLVSLTVAPVPPPPPSAPAAP